MLAAKHSPVVKISNPKCFLDIRIGERSAGRVVVELFYDTVPLTCENFKQLCKGTKKSPKGVPLAYKGSKFHRVIKNFMMQGGDFTEGNGCGGLSIYGPTFKDENFRMKHTEPGLLSMANSGKNTNGSQFFITFAECRHLDNNHVVFGKVVEGWEVCREVERLRTDRNDKPVSPVTIENCGELEASQEPKPKKQKHKKKHKKEKPIKKPKKSRH